MKTRGKSLRLITGLLYLFFCSGYLFAANLPTDEEITNAVENELVFHSVTPSYMVDVNTQEGIVKLSGSVNNILARDRAVQIAMAIKGVKAVIDEIKVDAPYRSDFALKSDVEESLLKDPATDSYKIDVNADSGIVTLDGKVDSWQEKQLAEFVAKGVSGVKDLINNLSVDYKLSRPDNEIKNDIVQAIKNDIRIDGALVNVAVHNGNVVISGTVGSATEKSIAGAYAWTVGVKSVDTKNLKVSNWARDAELRENKYAEKSDSAIKDAVKLAYVYDPRVFSFNPDISVQDGVVTLTGIVDNLKASRASEQDAYNVVGVMGVNNFLKVRPIYIPDDNDLESDIQNAITKDPAMDKLKVDITADHGVIYLSGTVNTYFQKMQADDDASRTKGVIAVKNNIKVNDTNDRYFFGYYGWNTFYPPSHNGSSYHIKSDNEIKRDIERQLWWSPFVNENEITVAVSNGKAILSGTVGTKQEKLFAEIKAFDGGAKEVVNDIHVIPSH